MARFAFAALFVCAFAGSSAQVSMTPDQFGMEMTVRAMEAVCWYENLRIFPNTNTKGYRGCTEQAKQQKDFVTTNQFYKDHPKMQLTGFANGVKTQVLGSYPDQYRSNCEALLDDLNATPKVDESATLNDGGNTYPFKAFDYCMLDTLRQTHGDEAIEAVKNEKIVFIKDWVSTALDRENAFRGRHGAEPLQLVKELQDAAQSWAEQNAKECRMYHSNRDADMRQYQGQGTGENIFAATGAKEDANSALQATDSWYEEIKSYPYPGGFKGQTGDPLFEKIGHFTQTVWKGSQYAGFGYAYNPNCKPYTQYITARYFPAGNYEGQYPENVAPPQDS